MGIDFTHCDAHWAYSGFNRFREKLAKEIGMDYNAMAGFCSNGLSWDNISDDIAPLLNHSDCDGHLTPTECKRVAPRLRELVNKWPEDDYDRMKALELANGMEDAAKAKENLEFC